MNMYLTHARTSRNTACTQFAHLWCHLFCVFGRVKALSHCTLR